MTRNNTSRRRQSNVGSAIGIARRYVNALLKNDQAVLDDMTLYKSGAMGGSKSNVSSLGKAGVSRITHIVSDGKLAVAFLAPEGSADPTCAASFKIVGRNVMSDWRFMTIS